MASNSKKVGKWNLGYGSNMNVKHITEKKGVRILGKANLFEYPRNETIYKVIMVFWQLGWAELAFEVSKVCPMPSFSAVSAITQADPGRGFLTQLPSEQNMSFPVPKRNQKQQFLLTGRERAGPTGSMLLEVYATL